MNKPTKQFTIEKVQKYQTVNRSPILLSDAYGNSIALRINNSTLNLNTFSHGYQVGATTDEDLVNCLLKSTKSPDAFQKINCSRITEKGKDLFLNLTENHISSRKKDICRLVAPAPFFDTQPSLQYLN